MSYMDLLMSGPPQPQAQPAQTPQAPAQQGPSRSYMELLTGSGQELRNQPPGTRMGSGSVQDVTGRGAPIATRAAASMLPSEGDQIAVMSRQMGIPRERFGVIDGNIVYQGDDGQIYRANPSVSGASGPLDAWRRATGWIASQFGPSLPQVAAGVTGAAMGPTPMSVPAAGATAGAVDAARQFAGRSLFLGEGAGEAASGIEGLNVAGQAALGAGGQGAGALLNRALSRNPLGVQAYERNKALDPAFQAEVARIQAEARSRGIDLTTGQATQLRSLLQQERQLGRRPETVDMMWERSQAQRGSQVPSAVRNEIDAIAPGTTGMGQEARINQFREGAEAVADRAFSQRSAQARTAYTTALDNRQPLPLTPELQSLLNRPSMAQAWQKAQALAKEEGVSLPQYFTVDADGKLIAKQAPDWRAWDYIKRGLDEVVQANTDQFGRVNNMGRVVGDTRRSMLNILDQANPDYAAARSMYGTASDAISAILDGKVGSIAKLEGEQGVSLINRAFSSSSILPEQVTRMRDQFAKAGRLDDFNRGFAGWLAERLDDAMRINTQGQSNNVPGRFYSSVFGDERQRNIVRAALGDKGRIEGFENLMEVLKRAASSLPEGSPTATDAGANRPVAGAAVRFLGGAASPQTYLNLGNEAVAAWERLRTPGANIQLANALLSGRVDEQLKQLQMLSPRSQGALTASTQILVNALLGGSGATRPADASIGSFRATSPQGQQQP